jgi:periplasmic divalent cation tolerance protein
MKSDAIVVMVTAPNIQVARQIADVLIKNRLAACVNILPQIQSVYTWQGEIHDDQEVLLIIKSRAPLFEDALVPAVQSVHPYDVPEIIALPIQMGAQNYLDWIAAETVLA